MRAGSCSSSEPASGRASRSWAAGRVASPSSTTTATTVTIGHARDGAHPAEEEAALSAGARERVGRGGAATAGPGSSPSAVAASAFRVVSAGRPRRSAVSVTAGRSPPRPASASTAGCPRKRFATIRMPAKPSSAGVSVIEISTAIATASAAATPIVVRNGMLATLSPSSAMITVIAANTTAEPAVATARAADSSGSGSPASPGPGAGR